MEPKAHIVYYDHDDQESRWDGPVATADCNRQSVIPIRGKAISLSKVLNRGTREALLNRGKCLRWTGNEAFTP
jgi:hypothetical protein